MIPTQLCPAYLPSQKCFSLAESTPPPPKREKELILRMSEGQCDTTSLSTSEQVAKEMGTYFHHQILDIKSPPLESWKAGKAISNSYLAGLLTIICVSAQLVSPERELFVLCGTLSRAR